MSNVFDDIEKIEPKTPEAESLENNITPVPELGESCEVYGDPYELGERLDDEQGDNPYGAGGDCGLVSIANLLTTAGIDMGEDDVVGYAIKNNFCTYSPFIPYDQRGGTNCYDRVNLLQSLGVGASVCFSNEAGGSIESVAEYIEDGRGVILGLNAGVIWDDPSAVGDGGSNHCVFATGTVRDPESGKLLGITVCDSGRVGEPSSSNFISVDVLRDAYIDAPRANCVVTDNPIR